MPTGDDAAAGFGVIVAGLQAQRDHIGGMRPELVFEDVPAPRTLAPYASAIAATVWVEDDDIAGGRLVLLYDPAGQTGWAGPLRVIAYIRADLDPDIAEDPLIGQVGWTWLTEALDSRTAGYAEPSGTVTTEVTEGFGAKESEPAVTGFELRASWSPAGPEAGPAPGPEILDGHLTAWCDALCAAAGLPPLAEGVTALPPSSRRPRLWSRKTSHPHRAPRTPVTRPGRPRRRGSNLIRRPPLSSSNGHRPSRCWNPGTACRRW